MLRRVHHPVGGRRARRPRRTRRGAATPGRSAARWNVGPGLTSADLARLVTEDRIDTLILSADAAASIERLAAGIAPPSTGWALRRNDRALGASCARAYEECELLEPPARSGFHEGRMRTRA